MSEIVAGTCNGVPMVVSRTIRRDNLKEFIRAYRDLPELWDMSNKAYSVKKIRSAAYDKLLLVYKKLDSSATVEDVRKKINIIRTNFRKQLKKINEKRQISCEEDEICCYDTQESTSWLFEELRFLIDFEVPSMKTITSVGETSITAASDSEEEQESSYTDSIPKKRKLVENQQVQQCLTYDFPDEETCMAKVWTSKLKSLESDQKLFAEKAINDILFEAKLGTLHRHSVQINQLDQS